MKQLGNYILVNNFDEVVLVDFPGFNIRLGRWLKKHRPSIKITYLCPPQMWCWGAWRIKSVKSISDNVIVLYPFEVEWYAKRGLHTQWIGNAVCEKLAPFMNDTQKQNLVAIIAGSRESEIKNLLPLFAEVAYSLSKLFPNARFIIPLAESMKENYLYEQLKQTDFAKILDKVDIVSGEENKMKKLSQCCLCLSKPGTITLELALLSVPTVVAFKTSWLSYIIGRTLVRVKFMSLPNLLLNEEIFPEFIQSKCTHKKLLAAMTKIYQNFLNQDFEYQKTVENIRKIIKVCFPPL